MNTDHDTIVAPATAAGGAIAVIRISGGEAFAVCDGYSGPAAARRGRRLHGALRHGSRRRPRDRRRAGDRFPRPALLHGRRLCRNLVPRLLLHRLGNPPAADRRRRTHGPAGRIHHPRLPGRETRPLAGRGRGRHDRLVVTRRARAGLDADARADTPKSSNRCAKNC